MSQLALAHGFAFADLYRREGLERLDAAFVERLGADDAPLRARLLAARAAPDALGAKDESALILELAPHLERFVAGLFGIEKEAQGLARRHEELAPVYAVKRQFVQRRAANKIKPEAAAALDGAQLERELRRLFGGRFDELAFAQHVTRWLADEAAHAHELDLATRYAAWALHTDEGRETARNGVLFKAPAKVDPHHLLHNAENVSLHGTSAYRIKAGTCGAAKASG